MRKSTPLISLFLMALLLAACGMPGAPAPAAPPSAAGAPAMPAPTAEQPAQPAVPAANYVGAYQASLPAADSPGREITLVLAEDGSATLTSDYLNDQPAVVESGVWQANADGSISVTLTAQGDQPYYEPLSADFVLEGDQLSLVGVTQAYGAAGLALTRVAAEPAAEAAAEPVAETAPITATVAPAPAITATTATSITAAAPITATAATTATLAAPASAQEDLQDTFIALRPAASGGGTQLIALRLSDDGAAQLATEFDNGQPAIVESGVWQDNGDDTLTVTLTGQQGQPYDQPVIITVQRDGDYLATVGADERFGAEGLRLRQAEAVARDVSASLFTMDLEAGFPLDPTFLSVNGGGEVDASLLATTCSGFIHRQPVVTVNWTGTAQFIEAFFVSDHNPTLLVLTPDGQVLCNDNANPQLLDPVIQIDNPMEGQYKIWIGSASANQLIPGVLVLTTKPEINLGTFNLGGFIKRPALPEVLPEPTPDPAAAAVTQPPAMARVAAPELSPGSTPITVAVTAEGVFPTFAIPQLKDKGCAGLVAAQPDYLFQWSGQTENLRILFEGNQDASLLVINLSGPIVACNDDSRLDKNANPVIDLANPPEGLYSVFVGRFDPSRPVTGTLTISEQAIEPATLAPAMQQP